MKVYMIDHNKCTGCHLCEMACSFKHHGVFSAELSNIKIECIEDIAFNVPTKCMHCEEPSCIKSCVAGALHRDDKTGAIIISRDKCIGCKACVMACPFGAVSLVKKGKKLNISICDLCSGDPECVKVCRAGAITYVDESKVNNKKRNSNLCRAIDGAENDKLK